MSDYDIEATITADSSGYEGALNRITSGLSQWGFSLDKLYGKGDEVFKQFGVNIDGLAGKLGMSGELLTGIAAIGVVAVEAGKQLFELGVQFDETSSTIGRATGATGASLDGLNESFRNVLASGEVEQSMSQVSAAFGLLSTKLDLTGAPLEKLTEDFGKFADINGVDLKQSVGEVTDVMNKWNISTAQAPDLMDQLTRASQMSGTSVDALSQQLKLGGAQFQELGLSLTDSLAMISAFNKEGVNSESVMFGLRYALGLWSKEGKEASTTLQSVFQQIKDAKSPTEALTIAVQNFGGRAGTDMAQAIRDGKVSIEEFEKSISMAKGTVDRTDEATKTFGDSMAAFGNQIKAAFAPVAEVLVEVGKLVLTVLVDAFHNLMNVLGPIFDAIKQVFGNVKNEFAGLVAILDGIVHGDWTKVWDGAQLTVLSMVKNIADGLSMMVNIFIGVINNMINAADKILDRIHLHISDIAQVSIASTLGITQAIGKLKEELGDIDKKPVKPVILGAPTITEPGAEPGALMPKVKPATVARDEASEEKADRQQQADMWSLMALNRLHTSVGPNGIQAGRPLQGPAPSEAGYATTAYTSGSEPGAITQALGQLTVQFGNSMRDSLDKLGQRLEHTQVGKVAAGAGAAGAQGAGGALGSVLGGVVEQFGGLLEILKPVQQILNPIQTILTAMMEVLKPVVTSILKPLVQVLDTFGVIIADTLMPVFELLAPIISLIAQVLMWLADNVIMPIGNFILMIWNGIANTINAVLGWLGVHLNTVPLMTAEGVQVQVVGIEGGGQSSGKSMGSYSNSYLGYASGTDYMPSAGWKLVGEQGPELLYANQGAKIQSASETRSAMSGKSVNVTYNITSPQPLTEAGISRLTRQTQRQLAFQGGL